MEGTAILNQPQGKLLKQGLRAQIQHQIPKLEQKALHKLCVPAVMPFAQPCPP